MGQKDAPKWHPGLLEKTITSVFVCLFPPLFFCLVAEFEPHPSKELPYRSEFWLGTWVAGFSGHRLLKMEVGNETEALHSYVPYVHSFLKDVTSQ